MIARPPPTTLEFIEDRALREPRRPALREEASELDYAQLHGMLLQCARLLHEMGVRRGQRVAVSGPGYGVQLVLLLACESLGAVTASFQAEGDPDAPALFGQVDWVFSALPQACPPNVRFHRIDPDFVRALAAPPAGAVAPRDPLALHEPQRISRTSGSTGRSKFMLLSRQAMEHWIHTGREKASWGPGTRVLILGPFVMNAAFTRSSMCLRRGGMLLFGAGDRMVQLGPTDIWGLPAHIERLLRELPHGYVAPGAVVVSTVGGALAPALRAELARVFHAAPGNRYGSNEVGPICEELDATGAGVLSAGTEVRILGPDGRELPQGQEGVIAVRSPALIDGYLGEPEATAAAFRDGWFVSGDVGALVGYRRLRLAGRHDDLVNIGGLKLPAAQLESAIAAQPAIAECAVLAVHLEGGAVSTGAALVLKPGAAAQDANLQLREALKLAPETVVRVLFLSELPRLQTGKVDRMALLRLFRA